jgi:cytochrome c biogenesis protein CcmG/thiol:disulfide interchange protein DsbE
MRRVSSGKHCRMDRQPLRSALVLALLCALPPAFLGLPVAAAASGTQASRGELLASGDALLEDLGRAPDFTLRTLQGDRIRLTEALERGPVILDFWATWCRPCRQALPQLQALYERYREAGLTVLAVSVDDPRSQPKIAPFARSQELTFPILTDGEKRAGRLYRITAVPTTFLISPEGRIVALHRGYRKGDIMLLEKQVRALLDRLPTPTAESKES